MFPAVAFNLGPGEQVVFEGHPSWRSIIDFYLKGAAITGVLVALVVIWGKTIGDGVSGGWVTAVLLVGVGITAIAGFLRRVSTRYTITNRRLHIKHGIVSREVQETRLTRVQDVQYSQSLIQRLLQIGDVDFDTASNDPTDFVFAGVAKPGGVVQAVHEATDDEDDAGLGERERRPAPPA
jgi:uncharacterized membrane protein YdbT with pleckstrin-like domain